MKLCYVVVIEEVRRRKPKSLDCIVYHKTKVDKQVEKILLESDDAIPYKISGEKSYYKVTKELFNQIEELAEKK